MTTTTSHLQFLAGLTLALGLGLTGCGDDAATETETDTTASSDTQNPSGTEPTTTDPSETGVPTSGPDSETGEPSDEAFVKRLIPLVQGRKPEGMREVVLLVQMIEQLDALGVNGRAIVARGLASGDLYLNRWKQFLWEELRINRIEVKSNFNCYSVPNGANTSPELAAFIRDNDAEGSSFGQQFSMADVMESALRLDDLSPVYRADMFARMARPLDGANISQEEFEINARSNFGEIFEAAYLGRRVGCLECHNSEESVTFNPDPQFNHFWAIPGNFERAIYGDPKGRPEAELYAIFRVTGFLDNQSGVRPWGMASCGRFNPDRNGDILGVPGYLGGELPAGQHLFDLDPLFRSGFETLAADGLDLEDNLDVRPDQALAYLTASNIVNGTWTEMMGYPLTLAHSFPRNERQREILRDLTETFVSEDYSLRALITEIAVHPYFNVDAPDLCPTTTPYFMEPVFEPYSPTTADPNRRGNGVGDRVQRFSAWVLIESAMRSMWWPLPVSQVPANQGNYPGLAFLRDQGVFLKDAQNGFNGVDFNGLLAWEDRLANGYNPNLGGACTGPLGQGCAPFEWIEQMLDTGSKTANVTVRDIAAAIKDRLLTEPTIDGPAEIAAIESIIGLPLDSPMNSVDAVELLLGARRYAGLLLNTPQFMLSGIPSRDQDPGEIPRFTAPGADTETLCNYLGPLILDGQYQWTCSPDGISVSK